MTFLCSLVNYLVPLIHVNLFLLHLCSSVTIKSVSIDLYLVLSPFTLYEKSFGCVNVLYDDPYEEKSLPPLAK